MSQEPGRTVEVTCPKCQGRVRFFFAAGTCQDFAHTVPSCGAWVDLNANTKSAAADDYAAQLGDRVRELLRGEN